MFRHLSLAITLTTCALYASAQADALESSTSSAASTPAESTAENPLVPLFSFTKEEANFDSSVDQSFCHLSPLKTLPKGIMVVAVRKVHCSGRYSGQNDFAEVLYSGESIYLPLSSLALSNDEIKQLESHTEAQIEASRNRWKGASLRVTLSQMDDAIKALEKTRKHGVAILDVGIYDTSEYTEGTGLRIEYYNSSKKTIKYVTVTAVGLNAVGDPVRGNSATIRGIGPIAPEENASYSRDYMWHTDLVQSFRITQVKLEYMDGTSKVISDIKNIRMPKSDLAIFNAPKP